MANIDFERLHSISNAVTDLFVNNDPKEIMELRPAPIELTSVCIDQLIFQNFDYEKPEFKQMAEQYSDKLAHILVDLAEENNGDLTEALLLSAKIILDSLLAVYSK